ncbi:MAG: AI-2E family transporter YdiK [Pseudomonadota bacterium]|nr:AI-2E family transporter YdiK [Pseudomonadota bacterium]
MAPDPPDRPDLARILLGALCIVALIVATFWIVQPFIAATIWATAIVVVTWPTMRSLQTRLWKSRALAILAMMVILLLLFVLPVLLAAATIVGNADLIVEEFQSLANLRMTMPPAWLAGMPLVGGPIAAAWRDLAQSGLDGLWVRFGPYAGSFTTWVVARLGNVGFLAIQFLLTLGLAAFMYAHGEVAAAAAFRLGRRLGGRQGEALVHLAGQAIRGVALGVGLTAAIQAVLGGLGLVVAGVPFAGLLTVAMFVLCVAQIGMLVVLIPAVIWVYWNGHPILGTVFLIWSLAGSLIDNVLRPLLVRRSADLPLLLIFIGVIGGLIAFGLLGLFVGPVVLAVAYTLLMTWIKERPVVAVRPSANIAPTDAIGPADPP